MLHRGDGSPQGDGSTGRRHHAAKMKPIGAIVSTENSGFQIIDPLKRAWSSPRTNAAETSPARIHPRGPRTRLGAWLTRYKPVPPASTTKLAQASRVRRANGSPRKPAAHVPDSHKKRMRDPMNRMLPRT